MNKLTKSLIALGLVAGLATIGWSAASNPASVQNGPAEVTEAHGSAYFDGGTLVNGSIGHNALGPPVAPIVTQVPGAVVGSTTYTYYCVGGDVNGNETINGVSGNITTGNATLSTANGNNVYCGGLRGAVYYRVLKADTAHSLGTCQANHTGGGCFVQDLTTGAGTAYTVNTIDQTNTIANGLASCGGTALVTAGQVEITAPCVGYSPALYHGCLAQVQSVVTPVAGMQANCLITSTATVIASATVTVGAVLINTNSTPSPSPTAGWFVF